MPTRTPHIQQVAVLFVSYVYVNTIYTRKRRDPDTDTNREGSERSKKRKKKGKGMEGKGMERKGTESVGATNTSKNFARCQNARGKRQVYKGESLRPQLYGRFQ